MGTHTDTLWLFALASKCDHFTTLPNLCYSLCLIAIIWVATRLLYWSHPGGPAWGKYSWTHLTKWAKKPIPGPRGWPILGRMDLWMGLAHRKIAAIADQHGAPAKRLMALSLGETRMIVTCDPIVAKEILNNPAFADRPDLECARGLMFDRTIGFSPYGAYWRTLRNVASTHMFCPRQIKAYEAQRKDIVAHVVDKIKSAQNGPFQVRHVLRLASLSNMMGSVFGLGLDECSKEVDQLKEMVNEGYDLMGIINFGDYFPFLADFDFQKVRFRCSQLVPKVNRFVTRIIDEHRSNPIRKVDGDFVDVLLSLQHPLKLSHSDMVAILWEMVIRGGDVTSVLTSKISDSS